MDQLDRNAAINWQLFVAEKLISQPYLDNKLTLAMLNALPADIGDDAQASVEAALKAVDVAAKGNSSHEALARYALARVITMLRRRLASGA